MQIQDKKESKLLKSLKAKTEINDVNAFTSVYSSALSSEGKELKYTFSKNTANKITEKVNVFVSGILANYKSNLGFSQRCVTFLTLTLTEEQKHTDKILIRMLAKFIDDLKNAKHKIIDWKTKTETNETALPLQNYFWRAETQENGNIHFHLLLDTFVNKNVVNRIWNNHLEKNGYSRSLASTRIESLKKINDVGAYICKYMTKPPLKDEYNNDKRIKKGLKPFKNEELDEIDNAVKYRRPIIGKMWGCSREVMKLKYIEFVENDISYALELTEKMKEYKSETLPECVSVYVGNVKELLKKCSYTLQRIFKVHYQRCYNQLYKKVEKIKTEIKQEVQYLDIVSSYPNQLQFPF